ncbi:uncharacterized protein BO97DRAFT_468092 [Aspergillus homomorphus CBS 101889]|uniref:Uncharacterized protein n=1 Tax=Aspergillus homomorphus (strain CBS 101889) TaxID=1450537 RepID=A0A395ICQ2_ASPHC|nr:hypothetical protein BO97DRAFT_468092 [Aspergillus homomorphus CBS 101889]RAL15954.1 hypothetical protein BO97DRAFT_468092 [Aspergillus homomorphus CBS 101889]
MRPLILFHPQLRAVLPRSARRSLNNKLFARPKTTEKATRSPKDEAPFIKKPLQEVRSLFPQKQLDPGTYAYGKLTMRKGPPELILIYNGGMNKTMLLAALKITTIMLYGATALFIAPHFLSGEYPSWYFPAIILGGAVPMVFMAYNGATWVCYVHLFLPMFARQSRQAAENYARNLPPTARLYITTMGFTTRPVRTEVKLGDLVPEYTLRRPVAFKNLRPSPGTRWFRPQTEFWAANKSHTGKQSTAFYPHLWPRVWSQIEQNGVQNAS